MPQPRTDASLPPAPRLPHDQAPPPPLAGMRSLDRLSIGEPDRTAIRAGVEKARRLADRDPAHPQCAQVRLSMGYRAAISFELHAGGLYRHLWIYMEAPGSLPTMSSIRLIAEEFGFELDSPIERHTWVEELAPGHHAANILEMQAPMPRNAA